MSSEVCKYCGQFITQTAGASWTHVESGLACPERHTAATPIDHDCKYCHKRHFNCCTKGCVPDLPPTPLRQQGGREGQFMSNTTNKPAAGLWRKNPDTPEGKYLVKRRDGTVVDWPNFVIGAKDPAAPAALMAYADAAEKLGMNPQYVSDVRHLADEFDNFRNDRGEGDPDRGRHRTDDPKTVAEMKGGKSA